jgi:hypothetical protein
MNPTADTRSFPRSATGGTLTVHEHVHGTIGTIETIGTLHFLLSPVACCLTPDAYFITCVAEGDLFQRWFKKP